MTNLIIHWAVLLSAFGVFWFLSFFCLLSVGLGEIDPKSGGPLSPKLLLKAGIATAIAATLWLLFYALIVFGVLDL